jgi:hypothetical protein
MLGHRILESEIEQIEEAALSHFFIPVIGSFLQKLISSDIYSFSSSVRHYLVRQLLQIAFLSYRGLAGNGYGR